jgi:endonuclease/exonuclease/phosphatase family metal-dependent hydrolase
MLCTTAIPYLAPYKFWLMGFLGLATPYIAGANILFILFWLLLGKWKRSFISALVIALSWSVFSVGLGGNFKINKHTAAEQQNAFKVMSYNVRLLDLYKWSGQASTRGNMIDFFKQRNADVLCLQEFFNSSDSNGLQNIGEIAKACGYAYTAESRNFNTKRGFFGDIIFSKYPIVSKQSMALLSNEHHRFQYADIDFKGSTIRVYNLHLESVRLSEGDKKAIEVGNMSKDVLNLDQEKVIVHKLKTTYPKRAKQADEVASSIDSYTGAKIVCGDLNDIPSTYTYFKVRSNLKDAFLKKGFGLGTTLKGLSPVLRIDNIFYSDAHLSITHFQNYQVEYSDHYPIEAWFTIK